MDGYPYASSPAAAAVMRGNRRSDTAPELRLRRALHARGLRYRVDYRITTGGRPVRADIVFTGPRVAVFVDGCFWHACPRHGTEPRANPGYWEPKLARNRARDLANTRDLRAAGWRVVRVWEHVPPATAAARIQRVLRGSR